MGLFNRNKMSKDAGEWTAVAMAMSLFADGSPSEAEIQVAKNQMATNPLIKHSIGPERAEEVFNEALQAIAPVPSAMIPTFEVKLAGLAKEVDDVNEKNFALAAVIAVMIGDGVVGEAENAALLKFQEMLGATIPLPKVGGSVPAEYQPTHLETGGTEAPGADVLCSGCGAATQFYEGYGHWCAACQTYTQPAAEQLPSEQVQAQSSGQTGAVLCQSCGQPTQHYEGYGHWCNPCQRYSA
ncbi:MAG: hypothetical protein KC561_00465 [Myxococcales bacterium]|nr:hypothetical protein [Myxococcales bacterium]